MKKHTLPPNLLVFAFLFSSVHILGSCRDVSKIEMIEDIDAYVNYIEHVHADPYRLTTRENFIRKAQDAVTTYDIE